MILVVDGKRYPVVHISKLKVKHALLLQQEIALNPMITSCRSWEEIRKLWTQYARLPKDEQRTHAEGLFLTALTIWASRVTAGEDMTLMEAIDFPITDLRWVEEPGDRTPAAGSVEAGKAPGPRTGGGGAGRRNPKGKRR